MSQGLLNAAQQGRLDHRAVASAAADAMNAAKPARGGKGGGRGSGHAGYGQEYSDFANSLDPQMRSLFPDAGTVSAMSRGGRPQDLEPRKIPVPGDEVDHRAAAHSSGLRAESSEFSPADTYSNGVPPMDPHVAQMQAMMAAQMSMGGMPGMGMAPMGMYPGMPQMMGMPPWGMYPMDPSFMMGGKGMMSPYGGAFDGSFPKAMFPGGAGGKGKGKAAGGGGKNQDRDKERRKRGTKAKGRPPSPPPEADDANIQRSEVLNEVRKNHGKCRFTLAEVMPHVLEFAKDQHGSRFLQNKLDEKTDDSDKDRAQVFEAILPHTKSLASDVFGNFVIQKLFEVCELEQKKLLAEELKGIILSLANETYGCRVIQKALQLLPRETQQLLATELKAHVGQCIESMHGNHVIQKCIEQMPPDSVTFIINAVNEKVEFWASHMYGCRVIQRLLEHCTSSQLPRMLDSILSSVKKLSMDPYGNYVVQHMLEHSRQEDKAKIIHVVGTNIVEFSKNKCSSNVVEKCFEIAAVGEHAVQLEKDRQMLYATVVGPMGDPNSSLMQMLDDRYGNYIVQRMIEYSKGDDRAMLQAKLLSVEQSLKNSTNGKHILSALHKEFGGRGE